MKKHEGEEQTKKNKVERTNKKLEINKRRRTRERTKEKGWYEKEQWRKIERKIY